MEQQTPKSLGPAQEDSPDIQQFTKRQARIQKSNKQNLQE